jgi:hypothetical protein
MEFEDKRWESLDAIFNGLEPEYQSELDHLKALYPDLPPDPNDIMYPLLMRVGDSWSKIRRKS